MKKYMYTLGLIILLAITLFILPVWNVEEIKVEGNVYYSGADLLKSISFEKGMHILRLNKKRVMEEMSKLGFIKEVDVAYGFPNHITLSVIERRPMGYVRFLDSYLCIDEEGYVIEQGIEKRLPLPEIQGLQFSQFIIGEKLDVENSEQLIVVKEMVATLNKYKFVEQVDVIEVSNIQQIHLYVDRLNVIIGNIRDFDKKVKYLIEVHKEYAMGILDLTLVDHKQAILKPMN